MRKFLSLIVVLMLAFNVKAQGLAITEAADFTFSDNGTEKTLFEVLDNGQHALLFFLNYQSTSDALIGIINGVYNNLGENQNDVYMIGIDPANENVLLNQWAYLYEVEFPLVSKDQGAYNLSQTYGGMTGVFTPALILIAPNHDIILEEIWPITSADQVVGIINDNLADGDEGEDPVDPETPVGLAAPANVVATTTETTVTLTWDAVDGATEYNIYTPASFDSNVLGLTETSYTFEGLTAGTEYCFEISAVSATDESNTTEACATTKAEDEEPEIPVDPETPVGLAIPTNVVATATSETTIVLTWDAVDGATEYNIYTPASFDSNVLGVTETTYTFEGLTAGTNYCFEVSAASATDESDTAEACATTQTEGDDDDDDDPEYPEPTTVPDAPVINVYAENSGLIVIEWEAVETAIFYYVYYKGNLVGDGQVMGTEVEILVNPETEYCFTVTAVNTVGESEHSNEACATTPAEGEDPINPDGNVEVAENDFVIYPNPVNDKLYIETETEVKEVVVYDIFGRRQELSAVSHQPSAIDVSNLNSGIYFVKVVTENGEVVKRFVKK